MVLMDAFEGIFVHTLVSIPKRTRVGEFVGQSSISPALSLKFWGNKQTIEGEALRGQLVPASETHDNLRLPNAVIPNKPLKALKMAQICEYLSPFRTQKP